ncbi:MAG: glycosyltransferase family 4 protein [Proteobacteria bacterium]|nr:glycosyltransferase family 4 protein [Pseudomonadota bacterium]
MRILLPVHVFFPKHFYGTETYTLELAQALKKMGHDPIVLTALPLWENGGTDKFYFTYEYDGLTVHCLDFNLKPHASFRQIYHRPELYSVYDEILGNIKPDIVHVTHIINHTATLLEVLRDKNIPTVATLTDFFGICFNAKLDTEDGTLCRGPNEKSTNCLRCYLRKVDIFPRQQLLNKHFMKNGFITYIASIALPYLAKSPLGKNNYIADQILGVTERVDLLRRLYGTYRSMIAPTDFLYEAYETNQFYPEKLHKINFGINRELVKAYQTPRKKTDSRIRFGFIGQIAAHKGVDLLINAYLRIKSDEISLSIYGSPDQEAYMKELVRLSSTGDRIEFCGTFPREELPARLSELDVLVIPSRWYENSPLVLLYALATRTPVIVTDVKGMSEFVKDGVNGYTFQKNSVEHLTAVMQRIVSDPSSIERLSQNAVYLKDVSDHAKDVLKLYTAALDGQREVLQDP